MGRFCLLCQILSTDKYSWISFILFGIGTAQVVMQKFSTQFTCIIYLDNLISDCSFHLLYLTPIQINGYGVVITIGVLIGDQSLTATTATISTVAQINKIMDTVHGFWVFFTPILVVNE